MKKLIVTGAHSTGKTILAQAIIEDLNSLGLRTSFVPDVARKCPFPIGLSQTEQGTQWLLHQQIANELQAGVAGVDWIVCDRGIPDILAHWADIRLRGGQDAQPIVQLMPYLVDWVRTYDFVFHSLVDERIPPAADGLREHNATYRMNIEQLIKQELQKFALELFSLPFDIVERRDLIKSKLKLSI